MNGKIMRWFLGGVLAGVVLASSTWAALVLAGWSTSQLVHGLQRALTARDVAPDRGAELRAGEPEAVPGCVFWDPEFNGDDRDRGFFELAPDEHRSEGFGHLGEQFDEEGRPLTLRHDELEIGQLGHGGVDRIGRWHFWAPGLRPAKRRYLARHDAPDQPARQRGRMPHERRREAGEHFLGDVFDIRTAHALPSDEQTRAPPPRTPRFGIHTSLRGLKGSTRTRGRA